MNTTAKQPVSTRVIATVPETPMTEVMRLMQQHCISCIVVAQGDTPVGILTERDIARTGARLKGELSGYTARDLMSADLAVIGASDDLFAAYALMRRRAIRHLVVVDEEGRAQGVITLSDLVHQLGTQYLADMQRVGEVMTRDIITVSEQASLLEAMHVMAEKSISCLICMRAGRPIGIVTERDIVSQLLIGRDALERPICKVMLGPVLTVSMDEYAFEAATLMDEHGVRHLVVVDENDKVLGLVTQSDIVDTLIHGRVALEMQVRTRSQELARKNEELTAANQQLRDLDQMKSGFLSSVSHELRTPLTSLLGFAKLIARDFDSRFMPLIQDEPSLAPLAVRIRKNLSIIVDEGRRMTRLINDFLDLTKIESGSMQWRDRDIPAHEFICQACQAVRGQFEARPEVELVVRTPGDLPVVHADMDRLLQVMTNLLNNAAKFTRRGRVTVEAEALDPGLVEVRVKDTGEGMTAEEMGRIFDKFHQLDNQDRGADSAKGSGLGLPIAKEIVEHYKGSIWATSEPGKGSTFHFCLPAAQAPAPASGAALQAASLPPKALAAAERPLVLVVDDDPAVRDCLARLFEREGFRAAAAEDGLSALLRARELRPDLVVMDLMMPGLDGGAAIGRLREDPLTQDVPVLVLSAYPDLDLSGGDRAMPMDEKAIVQAVRGLLQGGRVPGRSCIVVPRRKKHGNLLTISSGKIRYVKPAEIGLQASDHFQGTAFLPIRGRFSDHLDRLSDFDDTLMVIMPDSN